MKEKVILLFKIPSDHLEICNPVIYDVREIFFDEPNKNEKARKKLITSNVSHVQNTMSKISTIVNICYKKKTLPNSIEHSVLEVSGILGVYRV